MARMTRRELIEKFVEIIENGSLDNLSPIEFLKASEEGYAEAERLAKESNIVGDAFVNLWNQACKIRERKLGIRENGK